MTKFEALKKDAEERLDSCELQLRTIEFKNERDIEFLKGNIRAYQNIVTLAGILIINDNHS